MEWTLVSGALLLCILGFCYCDSSEKKPDLSEEKRLMPAEKSDENSGEHPLYQIDDEIKKELKNPTAADKSFEVQLKILKNLVNYYNRLEHLYFGVRNNTARHLNLARELVKQDGPKFVKEEIDEKKLKEVYNWDEENWEFFRDYVQDVKTVWHNITANLKQKPTPMEIWFDKKLGL